MIQLAKNLQTAMNSKGYTAKQLAETARISEKTVNRMLDGDKCPSIDTLMRTSEALDTTVDYLLRGVNLVLGTADLAVLQERNDQLTASLEKMAVQIDALTTERDILKEQVWYHKSEYNVMQVKLEAAVKLLEVHEHYMKKQNS